MSNTQETITQKVMHIVKGHALVRVFWKEGVFHLSELEGGVETLVGVVSDNPYSEFYSEYLVSTGMLDSHLELEFIKQARETKSNGQSVLSSVNKEVKVDRGQVILEAGGLAGTSAYIVHERELGSIREVFGLSRDERIMFETDDTFEEFIGAGTSWKIASRSNSQNRSGDLVMIPEAKAYTEHVEGDLKFTLDSYTKDTGAGLELPVSIQTRLKMSASSGQPFDLFGGWVYVGKNKVSFEGLDGETAEGIEYIYEERGKERKLLVLADDFTVRLEQEIVSPEFKEDGTMTIVRGVEVLEKPATDGSSYGDMAYLESKGINKDFQNRVTPVMKGMMNNVRGLEKTLGYTFIFFGGAVKGNPAPYLETNHIEAYILGEARDEKTLADDYLMASNQLVRDLAMLEESTLDVLERDTKEILNRAYAQDTDALKVFIGLDENTEVEEGETVQLDSENLTVSLFGANDDAFLRSDMFKKRLSDFIRPASREVEHAGRYYSPDSSYRHMVSDPYEVVRHMEKGRLGIDTLVSEDMEGIAPGHVISNNKHEGVFGLDDRKAILGRFPLLHHLEIQVTNEEGPTFLNAPARSVYEKLFESGRGQGLLYYSLYDMVAEGQSGADFDGDTTTVIRNPELTALVHSKPKFLDYSYLNGDLVEGVPWKSVSTTPLMDILSSSKVDYLEAQGVSYDNGVFSFEDVALENDLVREYIYETIIRLDGLTNENNSIGRFTNINASVTELLMVLEGKRTEARGIGADDLVVNLTKEINGYKKLNFLLASAIRWEIDKAKHGGKFYEKLPFLDYLLNVPSENKLNVAVTLEQKYGISLVRLTKDFEDMNDRVNNGLKEAGLDRVVLERPDWYSSDLNLSASSYQGKGIGKGARYNSRYDFYIDDMKALSDKNTKDFKINEYKNGLLDEATAYIRMMNDEGVESLLINHEGNEESLYDAKMAIERGANVDTPARLLSSYRKQMRNISEEIGEMEQDLISRIEQRLGGQLLNRENLGLEALMKKAHVEEDERKMGYELIARKELIADEHKGLGESFTPRSPRASALLFAELYSANIRSQNNSRAESLTNKRHVDNLRKEALKFLGKQWVNKFGNKQPSSSDVTNIKRWVEDYVEDNVYNDTGWGSIITLFPLGAVQFMEFIKDGAIKTDSALGRHVAVYMELEQGGILPANLRKALKDAEGRRIDINEGAWSVFKINKEDLSGRNKEVNASAKDLENLRNTTRHHEIKKMQFERGAHLWNRKRSGRIVMAVVYKEGVKLFLEDSEEIA